MYAHFLFLERLASIDVGVDLNQVMGEGEEQGVVKIADFGLARIYQAPLKPLFENGVSHLSCKYFGKQI